jgi:hypothetical protein
MNGDDGECDTDGSAYDGEDADFGQGSLQKMGGRSSECGTHGCFAIPTDGSSKLRVGEIDACDEQDAEDGRQKQPEPR